MGVQSLKKLITKKQINKTTATLSKAFKFNYFNFHMTNLNSKKQTDIFQLSRTSKRLFSQNLNNNTEKEAKENNEQTEDQSNEKESDKNSGNDVFQRKYNELNEEMKSLNAELDSYRQKHSKVSKAYLANKEETELIKKRYEKEVANTKEFAITKFAKDVLDIHDNFGRALGSIKDHDFSAISSEEKNDVFNSFLEGKMN